MAPGPYHLVLRDLSALHQPAGLPPVRSKLWLPVQFVLRDAGAAPAEGAARAARSPDGRQGAGLSAARRYADEHTAEVGPVGRNRSAIATGAGTRGAAPGAAADGPVAPVQPVASEACLRPALAGRVGTQRAIQAAAGRLGRDRRLYRRLRLRQRRAASSGMAAAVRDQRPAGEERRVAGFHGGRRATARRGFGVWPAGKRRKPGG